MIKLIPTVPTIGRMVIASTRKACISKYTGTRIQPFTTLAYLNEYEITNTEDTGQFVVETRTYSDGIVLESALTYSGDYIGDVKTATDLYAKGIFPEKKREDCTICSIGFCPAENKWYGWSHRAIYGFGVGSKVKKGDCAYKATDYKDFEDEMINFWSDRHHLNVRAKPHNNNGESGIFVEWDYDNKVPNEKLRGTISGVFCPYPKLGRGEWVAQTLDDAKQMAIDFADGVS